MFSSHPRRRARRLWTLLIVACFAFTVACSSSDDPAEFEVGDDCDSEGAIENNLICIDGTWVDEIPSQPQDVGVDANEVSPPAEDAGDGDDVDDHEDVGGEDDTGEALDAGTDDTGTDDDVGTDDDAGTDDDVGEECEPENDDEFCERHQVQCGTFTADDNCDEARTVDCADIGDLECSDPELCMLAEDEADLDTNICACPSLDPSDPSAACTYANAECGTITPEEVCADWDDLGDVDCGECSGDEECGTDIPNICGCPCEIDGDCFAANETDGDNVCSICDPDQSTDAFVDVEDGTECDTNAVCDTGDCVCDDGYELCNGECVDVNTDPDHCGDCNEPCSTDDPNAEAQCTQGLCEVACLDCEIGGVCVEAQETDDDNVCSICDPDQSTDAYVDAEDGTECDANAVCDTGDCVCDDDHELCDDQCVDFSTNIDHCGDCNEPCSTDASDAEAMCVESSCEIECDDDSLTYCSGDDICTDTDTDTDNCGSCGNACGDGVDCENGQCDVDDSVMEITAAATGWNHTCALATSGKVYCWGHGHEGQLGDGTDDDEYESRIPVEVEGIDNAVAIDAAGNYACALLGSGEVSCWGENDHGQLGDGTDDPTTTPTTVVDITDASDIATGNRHACAIEDGQVYCWGDNIHGKLGDGTDEDRLEPTAVSDELPDSAEMVSANFSHTCALANGDVYCWGANSNGRLGDGTEVTSHTPVEVTDLPTTITHITTGNSHTCAVNEPGNVYCWGSGAQGRLGNGDDANQYTPVGVLGLGGPAQTVSAGNQFACALLVDERVYCWGNGEYIGIGESENQDTAQELSTLQNISALSSGASNRHQCAVWDNGQLSCWGENDYGKLGDNQRADSTVFDRWLPTLVPTIEPIATEAGWCFTEEDNSGNGLIDCEDPDCATDLGDTTGQQLATGKVHGYAGNYTRGTCGETGPEVMYGWTAPESQSYTIGISGDGAGHTLLYIREDSCTGFELACSDISGAPMIELDATEGEQYFIFIQSNHSFDNYELNIEPTD